MGGAFEGVFASPAKVAKSELFGTANKYREKDAAKTSKPNSKPEATKPELKPEPSRAQGGRRSKDDNGKKKTRKDRDIDKKAAEQESRQKAKRRKTPKQDSDKETMEVVGARAPAEEAVAEPGPSSAAQGDAAPLRKKLTPEEEAERLQRTVFVGNVSLEATKKALKKLFARAGKVESVRLRNVPVDPTQSAPKKALVASGQLNAEKRSSMSAYVVFASQEEARAATKLNMTEWMGKHLRVDLARAKTSDGHGTGALYDTTRTVFVGNLPFDVEEEDVIQALQSKDATSREPELAGAVHAVRCVRDGGSGMGKGIAYVMLRDTEAAKAAVRLAKGEPGLVIGGRTARVTRAMEGSRAGKGRAASGAAGGKEGMRGKRVGGAKSAEGARGKAGRGEGSREERGRGAKERPGAGAGAAKSREWEGKRVKPGSRGTGTPKGGDGERRGKGVRGGVAKRGAAGDRPRNRVSHSGASGKRPAVARKKEQSKRRKAAGVA